MTKNLISFFLLVCLGANMNNFQSLEINNYFNICDNMYVVCDNNKHILDSNSTNIIMLELDGLCENSNEMPALGVSIHNETITELKKGLWLILKYNDTQYHKDMPFDELLININSEDFGFNIIRGNNGTYDGRCYYLNINSNMSNLHNTIITILKKRTTG